MPGFEVAGRLGISRECVGVQASCGVVQLLCIEEMGQVKAFPVVLGQLLTRQESGQLALEGDEALGLANPFGRGVGQPDCSIPSS